MRHKRRSAAVENLEKLCVLREITGKQRKRLFGYDACMKILRPAPQRSERSIDALHVTLLLDPRKVRLAIESASGPGVAWTMRVPAPVAR